MAANAPVLSRYRLGEQIGAGGMGIVYKARDLLLDRDVAVKVIRADCRNPVMDTAFQREARLTSSLNHPGIITVYDVMTEPGQASIVMELVVGKPLNQLIPKEGLPIWRAVSLVIQICEAMAAAHAAGVIHRDLKPGNILIPDAGGVRIFDFGIAKLIQPLENDPATTVFGDKIVGTIAYMAPEQARGEPVDQRADIFSIGVILSQLLTGRLPFDAPNPLVLMRSMQDQPPLPVRRLRPGVPTGLEAVVLRALEKNRQRRFQSALEMLAHLRKFQDDLSIEETQTSLSAPLSVTEPPVSQNIREPHPFGSEKSSIAVLPFSSLSGDPEDNYMAAGLAAELIHALSGVPRLRVAPQTASFRIAEDVSAPLLVAKTLNTRYVLTGTVRHAGKRLRVSVELVDAFQEMVAWTHTYDRGMADIFAVQDDISKAIVSSIGGQVIRSETDAAYRIPTDNLDAWGLVRKAYHIWNYEFSPAGVEESMALLYRALELDPDYAAPWAYLGMYLMQMVLHGIAPDPAAACAEAVGAAERACALAPGDPEVLECCALVWLQNSRYEKSVQCLKRAVQISPYDLVAWGYLGLAYGTAGGEHEVREAYRILNQLIQDASDHPSLPYWLQFLTTACLRLGLYEEAIAAGRRCVELQPGYTLQQVLLAEALGRNGDLEEARLVLESIPRFNPNFTLEHFEKIVLAICRSQATVDLLCTCCKSLRAG